MTRRERFRRILDELAAITDDVLVARTLKDRVDELVGIAEEDAQGRATYVEWFTELLAEDYTGPWEVLPYAMYRLRWQEVLSRAQQKLREVEAKDAPPSSHGSQ